MLSVALEPLEPYDGSKRPWRCRCQVCGRESTPSLSNVRHNGTGCVWCARHRVDPNEAKALLLAAGLEPLKPFPGANHRWRCRCSTCGREIEPRYNEVRNGGGCAWCAGVRVDPEDARAVMLAASLEPLDPYPASNAPWRCRCLSCGRTVSPTYASVKAGSRCGYCAGNKVDPNNAVAAMLAVGLEPLEPYPGALAPWRCRCSTCGREVTPRLSNVQNGARCAYCARLRVDPDDARAMLLAVGLEPLEPYPGRHTAWRCRCKKCQREVRPQYGSVSAGRGCRYCAHLGFDFAAPGVVYLLRNDEHFAMKVGVTTAKARTDRIAQHTGRGWVLEARWEVSTGDRAVEIESAVLEWWRSDLGAPPALLASEMPQGGWSETASLLWVRIEDTSARIQAEVDFLSDTD